MKKTFIRCDNYLAMAGDMGLGSADRKEIDVIGDSSDDVEFDFKPAWEM